MKEEREEPAGQARQLPGCMYAVSVHQFGGLEAMVYETMPRPIPGKGQVLVRVKAAGVGPWDALIRAGKSGLHQSLPLVLGSDLAGIVEASGPGVSDFKLGEAVFGVTNPQFTGAYAEYAVADSAMIAPKPERLSYVEAASVPVVAVTAWQMLFDHGQVNARSRVLVQGAAGNVGAYAVQLAKWAGAEVIATAFTQDVEYVYSLHADQVIDVQKERFEERVQNIDVVLDTLGGDMLDRSFQVLKPGGALISVVAMPDQEKAARHRVRAPYFIVAVTTAGLSMIADMIDNGLLTVQVGETLPLSKAFLAHEMLAGRPHRRGKIVLEVLASAESQEVEANSALCEMEGIVCFDARSDSTSFQRAFAGSAPCL